MTFPTIILTSQPLPPFPPSFDTRVSPPTVKLGLPLVHEWQHFLATPPLQSSVKTLLIEQAARLTITAQNALLKLFEEPPAYARIILTLDSRDQLLPTLLSRCTIQTDLSPPRHPEPTEGLEPLITDLNSASLGHLVTLAQPYATTRDNAINLVTQLLHYHRSLNQHTPSLITTHRLSLLATTLTHLQANANPHLTLEHLFIHW